MSLENLNHSEELINPEDLPKASNSSATHLAGEIEIVSNDETLKLEAEENADDLVDKKSLKKGLEPHTALTLNISTSLHRKLLQKAASEGVDVSDLAAELLAEGLVLRAWEIMERKTTMRGGNSFSQSPARGQGRQNFRGQNGNSNSGNGYQSNSNSQQNHGRGRNYQNASNSNGSNNRRMNYNQIMDDSANFLEYVRSQEKKQK